MAFASRCQIRRESRELHCATLTPFRFKERKADMQALFLKQKSNLHAVMWEVREDKRWWTVAFLTADGSYHITSDNGRNVSAA